MELVALSGGADKVGFLDMEVMSERLRVFIFAVTSTAYGCYEHLARRVVSDMAAQYVRLSLATRRTCNSLRRNLITCIFFPKFYPSLGSVCTVLKMTHFSYKVCINVFGQTLELMFCNFNDFFTHILEI